MTIKFLAVEIPEPSRFEHRWYRDAAGVMQREFILEWDTLPCQDAITILNGPFLNSFALTCVNPTDNTETIFTVKGMEVNLGVLCEVSGALSYRDVRIVLLRTA